MIYYSRERYRHIKLGLMSVFFLHQLQHIPQVRDVIYTAINDILEVDGLRCPQDKLGSVVSCSKKVFEVLQVTIKQIPDFMPFNSKHRQGEEPKPLLMISCQPSSTSCSRPILQELSQILISSQGLPDI